MEIKHMDRFNEIALSVLKELYQSFPSPGYPTPTSIGMTKDDPYATGEPRPILSDEYQNFAQEIQSVIRWMIEAGYVNDRENKFAASYVLTEAGLIALNKIDNEFPTPEIIG